MPACPILATQKPPIPSSDLSPIATCLQTSYLTSQPPSATCLHPVSLHVSVMFLQKTSSRRRLQHPQQQVSSDHRYLLIQVSSALDKRICQHFRVTYWLFYMRMSMRKWLKGSSVVHSHAILRPFSRNWSSPIPSLITAPPTLACTA